jgi:hypothetical protein
MELSDVLSDKPAEPSAPAVEAPVEAAPVEPVQERAPDGKFAAKEPEKVEVTPEPPKVEMTEKERAFLATATEERRKRQALEQELAQLRQAQKEPPKAFLEDPEGAFNQHRQETEQAKQQIASMFIQEKMKTSEYHARKAYPDFDQKVDEFGKALKEIPGLYQEWLSAPDPADFAYQTAKTRMEWREAGDISKYKEKIEKEAMLKAEAAFNKRLEEIQKQKQAIPGSLSSAPGTAGSKPVWGGPTPLENILGR